MTGISNSTFLKAINEGVVKPQLVKGRKKAMYLESEILKIEGRRRSLQEFNVVLHPRAMNN